MTIKWRDMSWRFCHRNLGQVSENKLYQGGTSGNDKLHVNVHAANTCNDSTNECQQSRNGLIEANSITSLEADCSDQKGRQQSGETSAFNVRVHSWGDL